MQTDKPLKIMNAWKKEAQGTFWLRTNEGKPVALSELVVGASVASTSAPSPSSGDAAPIPAAVAKPVTSARMSPLFYMHLICYLYYIV